jgi:hypothetical protein
VGERRQKGHGKKRPRRFHRGVAEGRKAVPVIDGIVQAERRARTVQDAMRSVGARYHEDIELLDELRRSAPFVPRIEAAL